MCLTLPGSVGQKVSMRVWPPRLRTADQTQSSHHETQLRAVGIESRAEVSVQVTHQDKCAVRVKRKVHQMRLKIFHQQPLRVLNLCLVRFRRCHPQERDHWKFKARDEMNQ